MKLKTPHKIVMFYGNILQIDTRANWVGVDQNGVIMAFVKNHTLAMVVGK
jgi:hypothetical protein|nr:MAG TPA: hypothetical protein [Caudoviricetes sp.]